MSFFSQDSDCEGGCYNATQVYIGYIADVHFYDYAFTITEVENAYIEAAPSDFLWELSDCDLSVPSVGDVQTIARATAGAVLSF